MKRGIWAVLLLACAFLILQQLSATVRTHTAQTGQISILGPDGQPNPVVNENSQIGLIVTDASGRPITSGVTFESGSPEIATVDPTTGVVRGVQRGFATITARTATATVSEFVVVARVSKGNGKKVTGDQEVDTSGAVYLSDPQQRVIYKRERAGADPIVFAGQTGVRGNRDGQRLQAQFASPTGVAVDNRAQGGIYIADSLNHSIRKIDFLDRVATVLGTGAPGINRDDVTPFERVAFSSPQGVAVDSGGNLFIADTDNHAIYIADFARRELRLLAGNPGQAGKADGQGRQALFNKPTALSLRTASTTGFGSSDKTALLVADSANNRIRLVTLDGRVQTIGAQPSTVSPIFPQQQVEFEFRNPQSVSFDSSGNIYVVDDVGVSVVTQPLNDSRQLIQLAQPTVSFGRPVNVLASGNEVLVLDAGATSDTESIKSVTVGAPEILSLSQDSDRMQGGAEIEILGRNFAPESIVILGDTIAPEVKILSATRISFRVPAQDAPGKRTLSIITRGGVAQRVFSIIPRSFDELRVGEITTIAGGVPFLGDSGLANLATLNSPQGIFIDGNGQILIADSANHRIRRVDGAGVITTIAGNGVAGFTGDGGPAISASLDTPVGVVIDAAGNVYSSDSRGHRIRRVDGITGVITTVAGTGVKGYSGDGGPASKAALSFPLGLALDSANNLYVADSGNSCIRRIDARTGVITTIAGNGEFRFNGDGLPALQTALDPVQAVYDREGNLLIADLANNRIRRLNASTGIISTIAGDGVNRFAGDGGSAIAASFSFPDYVSLDAVGNLYIADQFNQRVRRVEASSGVINTIVGRSVDIGDGGPALDALITNPSDVLLDSAGNLIIVDTENAVVRKMNLSTGVITRLAGTGEVGATGDGGPATAATFFLPLKGALDRLGNLYIVDSFARKVRKIDASGIITTVAGSGTYGYSGDGGPAVNAELAGPQGVAVDSLGNIYIADTENHCIRRVDTRGIITTIAGNPNEPGFAGDGRPASNARMIFPLVLTVDSSNNLYIGDFGNNRVRRIDAATGIINTVAGDGTEGSEGDGGPATSASLSFVQGLAVDSEDNLLIVDSTAHRVRRVSARTGIITTVAGSGIAGYSGDGASALNARLNRPKGAVVDRSGNIYIAAGFNSSIRAIRNTPAGPTINSAGYAKPLLTISGSGFGTAGATVTLNGKNVTGFIQSQSDTTIVLKGTKKKLGLVRGANQLSVTVGGATASASFNF